MSPTSRCSESKLAWFDEASIPALCWIGHPIPAVVLPIATCLLFAFSKYKQYRDRQRQPRQSEKYQQQQHDQDYLPDNHDLTTELLRIAAFVAPFCSSLLVANYQTTCIGWLSLLGIDLEPPSFTGGYYLGAFVFLGAWMIMSLPALAKGDRRRAKRQPWATFVRESVFDGEAVGWAVSLQLVMWLGLNGVAMLYQ